MRKLGHRRTFGRIEMTAHDLMLGLILVTFTAFAVALLGVSLWSGAKKG